ncbi:hypothetical protein GYMLUDRAFT_72547 [Collybiopsis luxurians FD-317 M1]|uniref:Uncharacterized protein n=1 Tax=Collybiopsis luxurians FD-317 M1 TaxID=944289 RepID=A0A0D0CTN7_9AGAR|nr:hypothetical protein GYMLUDRAFT_72547 [Collybiopsis luxurians FD-317 M1]
MTEYDYSPEAYERYKAKLRSIDRWVQDTEKYEPANPFMPTPALGPVRLPGSETSSRRNPQRSYTAPTSRGSSSSSGAYGSTSNFYQPTSAPQRYDYSQYPYPGSPPTPPTGPPQRSNTFHTPPPAPRLPKRSNTSPQTQLYDPRVGVATRVMYQPYYAQPSSPSNSKSWIGKLFSGFRSASPSSAHSPVTSPAATIHTRHSRSKSAHHNYHRDRDRDRDRGDRDRERTRRRDEPRSKSHSRPTHSKHHKSRSSSL